MNELHQLRADYLECVRLHLWYAGSKFSLNRNKTSKALAAQYLFRAHIHYAEYLQRKNRS